MKLGMMTSVALALGFSMATPMMTKANDWHRDSDNDRYCHLDRDSDRYSHREYREEDRHEYRERQESERPVYRERTTARDVALCDVTERAMDRVNEYRHGRRIQSVQLVCDNGRDFYQFRIDDDRHGDFTLQIEPNGHLFSRIDR